MARVERLTVYPVKALSPQDRESVRVADSGALAGDREWALYGPEGDLVNGKRTARVHDLSTRLDDGVLTVDVDGGDRRTFDLETDRGAAEAFLGDFFDLPVELRRDPAGKPDRSGTVSVVSTATLEAVADWFDGATVDGMRRRLRANVEVSGVDPFWEDRFVGEAAPDFVVGGEETVRFEGDQHCGRCVVPTRDPDTGEATPDFRERFLERRRATYPEWVDPEAMPHDYTLMLIARVPERDRDVTVAVGDDVRVE